MKVNSTDQRDQIRVEISGIKFTIKAGRKQIIKLTIILCAFVIVMTLIVTSYKIPDWNKSKKPADHDISRLCPVFKC